MTKPYNATHHFSIYLPTYQNEKEEEVYNFEYLKQESMKELLEAFNITTEDESAMRKKFEEQMEARRKEMGEEETKLKAQKKEEDAACR
jgi:hypothetical protein